MSFSTLLTCKKHFLNRSNLATKTLFLFGLFRIFGVKNQSIFSTAFNPFFNNIFNLYTAFLILYRCLAMVTLVTTVTRMILLIKTL